MLIVLDNARDLDHVLPLIPGSPHCLVIVTSRNRLTGLVAVEGAHPFTLDPMPVDDARAMVRLRLGVERSEREPGAVDQIVGMCARLPLALAIVAARAATYPDVPLSAIARELHDAQGSLDAFSYDNTSDLRAVFSWSYRTLTPRAARVFRMLALHWGPDISLAASASLLGVPVREARSGLAELTRTRLMTEHVPGRFSFHDLVRAYALELGDELDTDTDQRAAVRRLLDHYLHSAHDIHLLLRPHQAPTPLSEPQPGVTPESVADYDNALVWFDAEQHVIESVVTKAASSGFADRAWQLALTMQQFFQRQSLHHTWAVTMQAGLDAARQAGDRVGEARSQRSLAGALYYLGDNDRALEHLKRTEELIDQLGWVSEKAYVQRNIADVLAHSGPTRAADYAAAMSYYERALELYRGIDHEQCVAMSIEGIAICRMRMGSPEDAIDLLHQSVALFQELGDRNGEANSWTTLGESHLMLGKVEVATELFQRALDLHRSARQRLGEVTDLVLYGDARSAAGDVAAARAAWEQALTIMVENQVGWAGPVVQTQAEVRARIDRLG
jgi:tetratricopeptide (TPR) repeat protein